MNPMTILFTVFLSSPFAWSASDELARQTIQYKSDNPGAVLDRTVDNVKAIFNRYQVKLDSGSKILSPLQVGGTQSNPTLKVTIQKCVAFICRTVVLDAEVSLSESRGNCARNLIMNVDLSRSGRDLTDVYKALTVGICDNPTAAGGARLDLLAKIERSSSYESGMVQREIFKLMQLQVQPITKALNETLKANGAE